MVHPTKLPEAELLADCDVKHLRRGGPGGQHRNKVETAVVIIYRPTGTRAEANERRSQAENYRHAVFRLRLRLAVSVRTDPPAEPSDLWRSRVRAGRILVNPSHADFPAVLAEALDKLAACDYDIRSAASGLAISSTQLSKFIRLEAAAWQRVNEARRSRGLPRLR
jgi:hypothetical protein